jgi:hypothetical protein
MHKPIYRRVSAEVVGSSTLLITSMTSGLTIISHDHHIRSCHDHICRLSVSTIKTCMPLAFNLMAIVYHQSWSANKQEDAEV